MFFFCFIACIQKRKKSGDLPFLHHLKHLFTFTFLQESNEEKHTLVSQSKQRHHKLHFLQKLGGQKPCWEQARLSSLVNKQVGKRHKKALKFLQGKCSAVQRSAVQCSEFTAMRCSAVQYSTVSYSKTNYLVYCHKVQES